MLFKYITKSYTASLFPEWPSLGRFRYKCFYASGQGPTKTYRFLYDPETATDNSCYSGMLRREDRDGDMPPFRKDDAGGPKRRKARYKSLSCRPRPEGRSPLQSCKTVQPSRRKRRQRRKAHRLRTRSVPWNFTWQSPPCPLSVSTCRTCSRQSRVRPAAAANPALPRRAPAAVWPGLAPRRCSTTSPAWSPTRPLWSSARRRATDLFHGNRATRRLPPAPGRDHAVGLPVFWPLRRAAGQCAPGERLCGLCTAPARPCDARRPRVSHRRGTRRLGTGAPPRAPFRGSQTESAPGRGCQRLHPHAQRAAPGHGPCPGAAPRRGQAAGRAGPGIDPGRRVEPGRNATGTRCAHGAAGPGVYCSISRRLRRRRRTSCWVASVSFSCCAAKISWA